MKKKRKKLWILSAVFLLVILLIFSACDERLKIQKYEIASEKIHSQVRIAVVADLHSCYYGKNQKALTKAINRQNPDILLYAGDIFDDKIPNDNTIALLKALQGNYPSYYVTGNHEYWSYRSREMIGIMKQYGVKVLSGEWETISANGQTLNICGVDDPDVDTYAMPGQLFSEQLQALEKAADNGEYTVLLSHRPELFEEYTRYPFDLMLTGHAHGGQWRIPGILNGVLAPDQGFFPEYGGGIYEKDGAAMIVSRGLGKESTPVVPRIYNRPELVIVDLIGGHA